MRPMRSLVPFLTSSCLALPVLAQNPTIDLNAWTVEHVNGSGPWTVDPTRLHVESTNTVNTDVSTFYSDFNVTLLEFRMRIDPAGGDDDLPGFLLGWQPGDSANATADYLVVDWKKVTQTFQDWGTAQAGLAISRQTGTFTRGYGGGPIDLWSHTLNCTELARSVNHGTTGWDFATDYFFRVLYTPSSVDVWLDGVLEFSLAGTFPPGRFACYNYSQSRTGFQFPIPGAFTLYGNGCQGSSGTPYLFGPETPYVGHAIPVIVANLPPNALAVVVLGLSDTSWSGLPLPASLAPLGAAGCSVLASPDVLLPATNFNGTAYMTIVLPPQVVPSSTPAFFVQSFAIDPAANTLGLVLSNAGSVAIGIR
jgi:hypothetical protein